MKKMIIGAALAATAITIQAPAAAAEIWLVKATFNYVKADGSVVVKAPAMEFTMPLGECKKGITRVTQMPHADMTMTQKACVKIDRDTKLVTASGWLMSPEIVTDVLQLDGTRSTALALDYGQQFDIETNSSIVRTRVGPYMVEMKRLTSDPVASAPVAVRTTPKRVAVARKVVNKPKVMAKVDARPTAKTVRTVKAEAPAPVAPIAPIAVAATSAPAAAAAPVAPVAPVAVAR